MRDNRVLLVGLPTLLTDLLEEAVQNALMDVVSAASNDPEVVEGLVEEQRATAVLFGLEPDDFRDVAGRLCKKFPDLAMFTLSEGGRCLHGIEMRPVLVRYGETPMEQLVRLIREPVAGRGIDH